MLNFKHKIAILICITSIGIIYVFSMKPIAQNNVYHHFSDTQVFFSIPNFWNVVSNIPFLIFGTMGILLVLKQFLIKRKTTLFLSNMFFFIGIFLTAIGSACYHLHPTTQTLMWDRLPMVITFMSFFTIIVSEYVNTTLGKYLVFPLISLGIVSVVYWNYTELIGVGDLRFYILIQFLPLLLIPLIFLMFKIDNQYKRYYWAIIGVYIAAKLFESLDGQLLLLTHFVSGHTIKHFVASLAPLIYLNKLKSSSCEKLSINP